MICSGADFEQRWSEVLQENIQAAKGDVTALDEQDLQDFYKSKLMKLVASLENEQKRQGIPLDNSN